MSKPHTADFTEELVDRWIRQAKIEMAEYERRLEYYYKLKAKFNTEELEKPT